MIELLLSLSVASSMIKQFGDCALSREMASLLLSSLDAIVGQTKSKQADW